MLLFGSVFPLFHGTLFVELKMCLALKKKNGWNLPPPKNDSVKLPRPLTTPPPPQNKGFFCGISKRNGRLTARRKWRQDFTNDTVVEDCKSQAATWAGLDADSRPGWKGCWTRAMTPGCGVSATGSCVLKAEGGGVFLKHF